LNESSVQSSNYKLSIIISAKNEEKIIVERIINLTEQSYDLSLVEIIVVSDGSTDATENLVQEIIENEKIKTEIKLISLDESRGKPNALNTAVNSSQGEILVFTDCRQKFEKDVLVNLVNYFIEPSIGAVSGELIFLESKDSSIQKQMGIYWKYEKYIRQMESKIGSTIGVTGAIYAMRKSLYDPLNQYTLIDDVVIPLAVLAKGYKVIFSRFAIAYDHVSINEKQEWNRKVRTLAGNWQLLNNKISKILNLKFRHICMVFSHKLSRIFAPFFLILIFVLSFLLEGVTYNILFILQVLIYFLVFISHFVPVLKKFKLVNLAYFFTLLNIAAIAGLVFWLTGKTKNVWKPSS
jgi:cellulose synthase/poly-beta-1,6-N-acetylglucosamine synthase-like glycosyltransferase